MSISYREAFDVFPQTMATMYIDAFVGAAFDGTLNHHCVMMTAIAKTIPVSALSSKYECTALHCHVVVSTLLAVGANPNAKCSTGTTPVWWRAFAGSPRQLQQLLDAGGSVNEPDNNGSTPLIALVRGNLNNAAARMDVLFACHELELNATYFQYTAEEWAMTKGYPKLAVAIAGEKARRMRWGAVRLVWVAGIAPASHLVKR
jgi:ankyrin repeat protein